MSHSEAKDILYPLQHGFRKNRSSKSQILEFITDLINTSKGNATQTGIMIMDFSKAFDKVPQNWLWLKVKYYGIRHNTLDWIKNFLNKWQQSVAVDREFSSCPSSLGRPTGIYHRPRTLSHLCQQFTQWYKIKGQALRWWYHHVPHHWQQWWLPAAQV